MKKCVLLICPPAHAGDVWMVVQTTRDGQIGYFEQIYSVSGDCKTGRYHLNIWSDFAKYAVDNVIV